MPQHVPRGLHKANNSLHTQQGRSIIEAREVAAAAGGSAVIGCAAAGSVVLFVTAVLSSSAVECISLARRNDLLNGWDDLLVGF